MALLILLIPSVVQSDPPPLVDRAPGERLPRLDARAQAAHHVRIRELPRDGVDPAACRSSCSWMKSSADCPSIVTISAPRGPGAASTFLSFLGGFTDPRTHVKWDLARVSATYATFVSWSSLGPSGQRRNESRSRNVRDHSKPFDL